MSSLQLQTYFLSVSPYFLLFHIYILHYKWCLPNKAFYYQFFTIPSTPYKFHPCFPVFSCRLLFLTTPIYLFLISFLPPFFLTNHVLAAAPDKPPSPPLGTLYPSFYISCIYFHMKALNIPIEYPFIHNTLPVGSYKHPWT